MASRAPHMPCTSGPSHAMTRAPWGAKNKPACEETLPTTAFTVSSHGACVLGESSQIAVNALFLKQKLCWKRWGRQKSLIAHTREGGTTFVSSGPRLLNWAIPWCLCGNVNVKKASWCVMGGGQVTDGPVETSPSRIRSSTLVTSPCFRPFSFSSMHT